MVDAPRLSWTFPLPRIHTGVPLANGTLGLLAWGDQALHLTIARAGFWDHRGGTPFSARITFAQLRRLLEAGDEAGVRAAFAPQGGSTSGPRLLQQHGGGRLVMTFPGWIPATATVDTGTGTLHLTWEKTGSPAAELRLRLAVDEEVAWCDWDAALGEPSIQLIPAGALQIADRQARGIAAPELWSDGAGGGALQRLPADDPLALAWRRTGTRLVLATALGPEAASVVRQRLDSDAQAGAARTAAWWTAYWASVPRFRLPDALLQRAVELGLWKQGGMTPPQGVAATLQGPWMEDDQPPPWSNDYHFNINVQLVYGPCLATNRADHLTPLWRLIRSWLPELQRNATAFFGAADALMLPHAVDDRCQVVGSFWTGTIDHACTAWVALMAWDHWRWTRDRAILAEIAWPLLTGAFAGYWAMVEEVDGRLSLPVSVSPEYNGADMNAWGRDASFQLAAAHALALALPQAARELGQAADPRWARLSAELPPYTTAPDPSGQRMALWQGQDLAASHRHHSHLAAIWPFRSLDPADSRHAGTVARSLRHWTATGSGGWTGWCLPWAAVLCARCGSGDAALAWLHWWQSGFTNGGDGSLHNAVAAGISAFCPPWPAGEDRHDREIMQMDAALGALWAVCELLVQDRGERICVLPAPPEHWATFSFDGLRACGAFLIGATIRRRQVMEVRVESLCGGELLIEPNLGRQVLVDGIAHPGPLLRLPTRAGQRLVLRRAG